jgi:hypothetical protein
MQPEIVNKYLLKKRGACADTDIRLAESNSGHTQKTWDGNELTKEEDLAGQNLLARDNFKFSRRNTDACRWKSRFSQPCDDAPHNKFRRESKSTTLLL